MTMDVRVYITFNGVSTDVSAYVLWEPGLQHDWARTGTASATDPAKMSLRLRSPGGLFNPNNKTSAYYSVDSYLGSPLVVTVDGTTLFTGGVTSISMEWDITENEFVNIEAKGPLAPAMRSTYSDTPYRRTVMAWSPTLYVPLTDGVDITKPYVAAGKATTWTGTVTMGQTAGIPGDDLVKCPDMIYYDVGGPEAIHITGITSSGASETRMSIGFAVKGWPVGVSDSSLIFEWATKNYRWRLYTNGAAPNQTLTLTWDIVSAYGPMGGSTITCTATNVLKNVWRDVRIIADTSGTTMTVGVYVDGNLYGSGSSSGRPGGVDTIAAYCLPNSMVDSYSLAHIYVYERVDLPDFGAPIWQYTWEDGAVRAVRFGAELGLTVACSDTTSHLLGIQKSGTAQEVLGRIEQADGGRFIESPTGGISYETMSARYGASVAMALTMSDLSEGIRPVVAIGDRPAMVSVTPEVGEKAVATAPYSLATEGTELSLTLNTPTTAQAQSWADYYLNEVEPGEDRRLTVMMKPGVGACSVSMASWLTKRAAPPIRFTLSGVPNRVDPYDFVVDGFTERINPIEMEVTLQCSPWGPYDVAQVLGSPTPAQPLRLGLSHDLVAAVTAGSTSARVCGTAGPAISLTPGDDLPCDIELGGERTTCTAVAAYTATYVAAGAASHADNATLTPALPAGISAGDLLLCVATARTASAYANCPTGWITVIDGVNVRIFGKYYSGSDSAPSVTFSGGASGCSTTAAILAFRGVALHGALGTVGSASAAANIATPQYTAPLDGFLGEELQLLVGWRADDWTGSAPPSGYTEALDVSTTLGDDQGLTVAYAINAARATIAPQTFTITGGSSAQTVGAALTLHADARTLTLTRGVNGTAWAHAAGDPVGLWRSGRIAA